jgi:hypothetical protein
MSCTRLGCSMSSAFQNAMPAGCRIAGVMLVLYLKHRRPQLLPADLIAL